jgi:hypothetical protein
MFPTLPALLAALWLCERRPAARLGWTALLLAGMVATASVAAWAWRGHAGAVGPFELLWTGKGVHSAWAGFSWAKVGYLWDGLAGYLLGTAITCIKAIPGWDAWRYIACGAMLVIAGVALTVLWRQKDVGRSRALVAVFGGTFVAGEVFNLYSQPQDPQMQINVMVWLTVAWASLLAALNARGVMLALLAVLSIAPLGWNVAALARYRGGDTDSLAVLDRLDRHFQTDRTVFLYWGFEPILVWQFSQWSRSWDMYFDKTVPDAPSANPKFKWLAVTTGAVRNAKWTPQEHAEQLKRDIDRVLDHGYRVAVDEVWGWGVDELAGHLAGLVAADRAPAIWSMLHDNYEATPVYTDPMLGPFWELRRRAH